MKRTALIFGLTIGTILCINMFIMVNMFYTNPGFKSNDALGYAALIVVFSLVFFGTLNYRNKQRDGYISFGKAFKTGFFIAFVGSTMYVVVWLFYYYLFVPDFIDKYTAHVLSKCATGDIPAKTKEMAQFREMYQQPWFVVVSTYIEVLPIGLIVAIISAFILKKKKEPTTV